MTKTHRLRIFTKSVKEGATDSTKVQKLDQWSVQIVNETATLKSDITVAATDAAIFNTTTAVQPIAKKICWLGNNELAVMKMKLMLDPIKWAWIQGDNKNPHNLNFERKFCPKQAEVRLF